MHTTIETYTGTFVDLVDPKSETIHVEDIARALSQISRFGGHTKFPYSVAQHALLVSRLVRNIAGPQLAFAALHHDSHDAYIGDVITPLKAIIKARAPGAWEDLVNGIDDAIGRRFSFQSWDFDHSIVRAADFEAMLIEASVLKRSRGVGSQWHHSGTEPAEVPTGAVMPCNPEWVEGLFLAAHRRLLSELGVVA